MNFMNLTNWYNKVDKPRWALPYSIYQQAWYIMYPLFIVSFLFTFIMWIFGNTAGFAVIIFTLSAGVNIAFPWVLVKQRNYQLTLYLLWAASALHFLTLLAVWPYFWWIGLLNMPYLGWLIFNAVFHIYVNLLNPSKPREELG